MNDNDILTILKIQLDYLPSNTSRDELFAHLIKVAKEEIAGEGISLNIDSIKDLHLVVMYAAYLYSKRKTGEGMPRMLRFALNNRMINEKARADK